MGEDPPADEVFLRRLHASLQQHVPGKLEQQRKIMYRNINFGRK